MMKHLTRSRGAAAALLLTSIVPALGAQGTEPARARSGDSVLVRVFGLPDVRLDSLKILVRELERQPFGSADFMAITHRLDSLLLSEKRSVLVRGMVGPRLAPRALLPAFEPSGWLGFVTQGPSQQIIDETGQHVIYLAYPSIISVDPNSPAERAGIRPGDVLVAYNGRDVVNRDFNLTELLRPERKVAITVRRDGDVKQYSVTVAPGPDRIRDRRKVLESGIVTIAGAGRVPRPPEEPMTPELSRDGPRGTTILRVPAPTVFFSGDDAKPESKVVWISPNGMFGASMSSVNADLAKVYGLKPGVLVNEVPEETPAWRAGLRTGDVIVRVDDQPVLTVNQFRDRVLTRLQQHAVALQVVRNQKPRTVTLTWSSP